MVERYFRDKVCEKLTISSEGIERYRVFTPFMFEDGDHLAILLKSENGKWLLSDEGHTYMHLTYDLDEKDLQRGTRQKLITNALSVGLDNPHPFSQMKTELIWEGKYDEHGNRRAVDIVGCAMPLQRIETVDEPASRAHVQNKLFDPFKAYQDDFRNRLIWGNNKLVMASLLKEFKGKI